MLISIGNNWKILLIQQQEPHQDGFNVQQQQQGVVPAKTRLTRCDSPTAAQQRTRSALRGNRTEAAQEAKKGDQATAKYDGEKNYPVKIKEGRPIRRINVSVRSFCCKT